MRDSSLVGDIVDTKFCVLPNTDEQVEDDVCPICSVAKESQIGQRLFRTAQLSFDLAQFVRKLYEELSITVPLVLRQC